MKLHGIENGEQYVINLLSRTNSILTHYYVLSAKNGKRITHPSTRMSHHKLLSRRVYIKCCWTTSPHSPIYVQHTEHFIVNTNQTINFLRHHLHKKKKNCNIKCTSCSDLHPNLFWKIFQYSEYSLKCIEKKNHIRWLGKFQNVTISFIMSVHLSTCREHAAPTGWVSMKFYIVNVLNMSQKYKIA
jgi:hypothetical protein